MSIKLDPEQKKAYENTNGIIFGLQAFSIHDGPGIRTNVFLKGCPLHCLWCHNPEGISRPIMLSLAANKCIGCGECFRVCPAVHQMVDGKAYPESRGL